MSILDNVLIKKELRVIGGVGAVAQSKLSLLNGDEKVLELSYGASEFANHVDLIEIITVFQKVRIGLCHGRFTEFQRAGSALIVILRLKIDLKKGDFLFLQTNLINQKV